MDAKSPSVRASQFFRKQTYANANPCVCHKNVTQCTVKWFSYIGHTQYMICTFQAHFRFLTRIQVSTYFVPLHCLICTFQAHSQPNTWFALFRHLSFFGSNWPYIHMNITIITVKWVPSIRHNLNMICTFQAHFRFLTLN